MIDKEPNQLCVNENQSKVCTIKIYTMFIIFAAVKYIISLFYLNIENGAQKKIMGETVDSTLYVRTICVQITSIIGVGH